MSNTIYDGKPSSKNYHKYNYVYLITNITNNKKYIGSRSCDIDPYIDIKRYKSSSNNKEFKLDQKNNPQNYKYEILSFHDNRDLANKEESRLHALYNVKNNHEYYNMSNQTINGFDTTGLVTVKDKNGNTFQISKDDPRYLSGELVHNTKNYMTAKDKDGNVFQVNKNDPRILSGELVGITKGKAIAKDKDGNILQVNKDDPRFKTGELVGLSKGRVAAKDKDGNIIHADVNDPRFKTGEIKAISKGKITAKDKVGNIFQIDKDDPKYLNGELIGVKGFWISIDGELYSKHIIKEKYNLSDKQLTARCKSDKWPNWNYVPG